MGSLSRSFAVIGFGIGFCFATTGMANNNPIDPKQLAPCSCDTPNKFEQASLRPKDNAPSGKLGDLQDLMPEPASSSDDSLQVNYSLEKVAKTELPNASIKRCSDGMDRLQNNTTTTEGFDLADAVTDIAPLETSTNFGAAAAAPAIGLIETTIVQTAAVGSKMLLFSQGEETASN